MGKSIFPKKFGDDINKHFELLRKEFKSIYNKNILEIATGSGNSAFFKNHDNQYTGIDISFGLLQQADSKFTKFGFKKFELKLLLLCIAYKQNSVLFNVTLKVIKLIKLIL